MAAPTATIEAVQRRLADTGLPNRELLTPAQYEDAIAGAVAEYSRDRPRVLFESIAGASTEFYRLDTLLSTWEIDHSLILRVEYPAGPADPGYTVPVVDPEWYTTFRDDVGQWLRFYANQPPVGTSIRVSYTAPHVHTSLVDTIPASDLTALRVLSAAHACLTLAARGASQVEGRQGVDSMDRNDRQNAYVRQYKEWHALYEKLIGVGLSAEATPVIASGRRVWQSVPALERDAERIVRGTR